jgi:hypothetical protein
MTEEVDEPPGFPRRLSKGRAFVYVIPCRDDTRFKVGFARDPMDRWRSFHARFYTYFDLHRGLLLETTRVAEARAIEQRLLSDFQAFEALAPLDIAAAAGGSSEWLRGVLDDVVAAAVTLAAERGLVVHDPASAWLRAHLLERRELLFEWSARLLEQVEYEREHGDPSCPRRAVRPPSPASGRPSTRDAPGTRSWWGNTRSTTQPGSGWRPRSILSRCSVPCQPRNRTTGKTVDCTPPR